MRRLGQMSPVATRQLTARPFGERLRIPRKRDEAYEDSRDSGSLTSRLRHVYWIGGASGAGKSTTRAAARQAWPSAVFDGRRDARPCASMAAGGMSEPDRVPEDEGPRVFCKCSVVIGCNPRWTDRGKSITARTCGVWARSRCVTGYGSAINTVLRRKKTNEIGVTG